MGSILVQFFSGLLDAMFLFLLASGLSLIFGVSRVINISHGAFYTLGAYAIYSATRGGALSPAAYFLVALLAATAIGMLGALFEMLVLRRTYRGGMLIVALVTFGALAVIEDMVKIVWSGDLVAAPFPRGLEGSVEVGGRRLPTYGLTLLATGGGIALAIWWAVERTRIGLMIRAAAIDREMLAVLGGNVPAVFTLTFAAGTFLAGLAGALAAPMVSILPNMGSSILIQAFAVVVIGGLGSLPGSLIGAFIVGQVQAFGILIAPESTLVLLYLLMAIVLVVRPTGLLGRTT